MAFIKKNKTIDTVLFMVPACIQPFLLQSLNGSIRAHRGFGFQIFSKNKLINDKPTTSKKFRNNDVVATQWFYGLAKQKDKYYGSYS